jgi:S-layer protein
LAIGTLTGSKITTIDASAYTGDLSLPAVAGAGAQAITTGTGNDTIAMGARLGATDTIDAGGNVAEASGAAGVDTVTLTGNIGSTVAATIPNISNAEVVQQAVGTNFASYIDGSKLTNVGEYAFSGTTGPLTLSNMPAGMEIGVGIGTGEMVSTLTYSLADATGTEDALTLDYSDTVDQVSTNALTTTGIETLNVKATKQSAGAVVQTLTLTNAGVATINVTDGHADDTLDFGTLNKATTTVTAGANKGMIDLIAAATSPGMTVSAPAAVIHAITLSAKADTVTLTGKMADVTNAIAGGASATGTVDVFNGTMTTTTTDLTSITGFETLNLSGTNSTAVGLDNGGEDGALQTASTVNILGGNANSSLSIATAQFDDGRTVTTPLKLDMSGFAGTTDVQFASDALDVFTTVVGSPQADHIKTIVAAAAAVTGNNPTMSGVEQLTVTTTNGDLDGSMSLAKVTDLTRLNVTYAGAAGDTIAFTGLAATTPIYVNSNHTSDSLSATLGSATGTADPLNLVMIGNTGTLDVNSAGVEVLNITTVTAGGTIDIGGISASTGSTQAVTVSGPAAVVLNNVHTSVASVNAAAAAGGLTIASGQRDSDALTVTGGPASDSIAMENVADVLDGGSNPTASASVGDTLEIVSAAILGGITVDLSAADQVTTMDGGANAAVQTGFEHVDLRGFTNFGAVVTGNDGINVITGTPAADRLGGGKGADVFQQALTNEANTDQISGGAGADTLNVLAGNYVPAADSSLVSVETIVVTGAGNLTLTTQTDNFTITANTGANVVTGSQGNDTFTGGVGADTFFVAGGAAFGYDNVIMDSAGSAVDILSFSGAKGTGAVNVTAFGGSGTDLFKVKANFAGGLTNGASSGVYLEDAGSNADGLIAPASTADTVVQLTQVVNAAASTAITNFQAAPSATTEAALVAAIVGSTGSNEAFDGGLHANYDDAGDVVVFLVQDADESVAFTYTAGAGTGTADTTLEVDEVDIIAVFDSVVTVALIAAQT